MSREHITPHFPDITNRGSPVQIELKFNYFEHGRRAADDRADSDYHFIYNLSRLDLASFYRL